MSLSFHPQDFASIIEFNEYFSTEKVCMDFLAYQRWGNTSCCPKCGNVAAYSFSDGIRYKCKSCRSIFNAKTGTVFEGSKIPLRKWFIVVYLLINDKKGISSYQAARMIGVSQRSAWFMLQRIRTGVECDNEMDGRELYAHGTVEMDETYIGGKAKNKHKNKRTRNSRGRSVADKTPVFGMIQRGGRLAAKVVPDTKGYTLQPLIFKAISRNVNIVTDEWYAYNGLWNRYNHSVVLHKARQYVNGDAHTNTIEGFWSHLKRSIVGVYHQVSRAHLQLYVNESVFRYNTRKLTDGFRFTLSLSLMEGRLKYKDLVNSQKV